MVSGGDLITDLKHMVEAVVSCLRPLPQILAVDTCVGGMYPVFVRGQAYLAAAKGKEAASEFQKIIDHRGAVINEPIGALAHVGLARAMHCRARK